MLKEWYTLIVRTENVCLFIKHNWDIPTMLKDWRSHM